MEIYSFFFSIYFVTSSSLLVLVVLALLSWWNHYQIASRCYPNSWRNWSVKNSSSEAYLLSITLTVLHQHNIWQFLQWESQTKIGRECTLPLIVSSNADSARGNSLKLMHNSRFAIHLRPLMIPHGKPWPWCTYPSVQFSKGCLPLYPALVISWHFRTTTQWYPWNRAQNSITSQFSTSLEKLRAHVTSCIPSVKRRFRVPWEIFFS